MCVTLHFSLFRTFVSPKVIQLKWVYKSLPPVLKNIKRPSHESSQCILLCLKATFPNVLITHSWYFTGDIKSELEMSGFYKEDIHLNGTRDVDVPKENKNYPT